MDGPVSGPIDDGPLRRWIALDEVPEEPSGVAFLDVVSGELELWTPPSGELTSVRFDDRGRWFVASTFEYVDGASIWRSTLTDRLSGSSYLVGWELVGMPNERGLAVFRSDDSFAVVDLEEAPGEVLSRFELPVVGIEGVTITPVDGDRAILGQAGALYWLELRTGLATSMGLEAWGRGILATDDGAFVRVQWSRVGEGDARELRFQRFDRDGGILVEGVIDPGLTTGGPYNQNHRVSPDGRWVAWQGQLPGGTPVGLGMPLMWPTVTIASLDDGTVRFRAVQASLTRYESRALGWLADSSGLIIATPDGYHVLGVDGSLRELPFDLEVVPVAAPHDPGLFVYGGQVVDSALTAATPPVALAERWANGITWYRQQHLSPDGSELRFARLHFFAGDGGSGTVAPLGPDVRVEWPPFADVQRLEVVGETEATVHARPNENARVVAVLASGAVVTHVAGQSDFCQSARQCLIEPDRTLPFGEAWWLHIETSDGATGWAPSQRFRWVD